MEQTPAFRPLEGSVLRDCRFFNTRKHRASAQFTDILATSLESAQQEKTLRLIDPMMSAPAANPVVAPDHVHALLNRLHQESLTQEEALPSTYLSSPDGFDDLMRDKFIALDQDKCHFVYQLARATGARNIVEVGTSFGVSTIYLALAVGSNLKHLGGGGMVIATEKEHEKAENARLHWREAGIDLVMRHIDLREGDLLETLRDNIPQVDLVLLDSEFNAIFTTVTLFLIDI